MKKKNKQRTFRIYKETSHLKDWLSIFLNNPFGINDFYTFTMQKYIYLLY